MRRALALVFAVALAARLAVRASLADAVLGRVVLGDGEVFVAWAREIAAGAWFGDEVFYQAPLYPYLLALVFALGGGLAAVYVVQAVLGAIACTLVAAATARLFDLRAAVVAGLAAALYAPSIWLEGLIQKSAPATVLVALFVFLLAGWIRDEERAETPHRPRSFAVGLTLGLLALLRENALVLVLLVVAWIALAAHRRRAAVPFLLGLLLVLVPVGLRNASLGGGFLPTASNFGVNLYIGNQRGADGLYLPMLPGRGHARYERADAQRLAEQASGTQLGPAEVSLHWAGRALDEVAADPAGWLRLMVWKTELLLHRSEQMDAVAYEAVQRESRLLELLGLVFHFGLLAPLAVLGAGLVLRDRQALWPLAAAPLLVTLSVALFFVTARFRLGLVPFLFPFAAIGGQELLRGLRNRFRRRRMLPQLTLAAAVALVANLPLEAWPLRLLGERVGDPVATTESNLASAFLRRGEPAEAYRHAAAALAFDPDDAYAILNLAHAAGELERVDEALAAYAEAERIAPGFASECRTNVGLLYARRGDLERALERFEAALAADPTNALAAYNRGLALRQLGREQEAARAYQEALRLDPTRPDAHHNLGYLRELQGRFEEALEHYDDALAADATFQLSLERSTRLLAMHPDARLRDGARALELARRLVELHESWSSLDLLAAALAETGDLEGAGVTARRAVELSETPDVRRVLEQRAQAYERGERRRL